MGAVVGVRHTLVLSVIPVVAVGAVGVVHTLVLVGVPVLATRTAWGAARAVAPG
jgi:hypothetical protein